MNELGTGFLRPTPRGGINLVRKGAHCSRDWDTLRGEEGQLAFPIETSRRDRRIRQPVERDVVDDVVARQPFGLSVEGACDERVTARSLPSSRSIRTIEPRIRISQPNCESG